MVIQQKILIVILLLFLGGALYCFQMYRKQLKNNTAIILENGKLRALNETKNRLLSVLSHDLKPAVYCLKELNDEIKEAVAAQRTDDFYGLIHQNMMMVNNTYSLLDNVLQWVLEETGRTFFKREKLHLKSLTDQVCHHLIPFMELKKITLVKKIAPRLFIYADANTVKIALRNLVENAVKYTPEHGIVNIYSVTAKDRLELIIADNGAGMDAGTLQNVFNPHKKIRKKDSYGNISTGLGLFLVKAMIEKNGGAIRIKSKPGKGTKVSITLKYNKL